MCDDYHGTLGLSLYRVLHLFNPSFSLPLSPSLFALHIYPLSWELQEQKVAKVLEVIHSQYRSILLALVFCPPDSNIAVP